MRNLDKLSAKNILEIDSPEILFSRSLTEAKREYRHLIKRWHPDSSHAGAANSVLSHIVELYKQACWKVKTNCWIEPVEKAEHIKPGRKKILATDGSIISFEYYTSNLFELGKTYIDDHNVIFEVRKQNKDLFTRARKQITALSFEDERMALEASKYLPQILETFEDEENLYLRLRKTPDQLRLSDVLTFCGGSLDARHLGWIINNLLNIACYLQWAGIAHLDISAQTVFVSPLRHSVMLLGGWWYSCPINQRMIALPDTSLRLLPETMIEDRLAKNNFDLVLIKALGLELLGAPLPHKHRARSKSLDTIPEAIIDWLKETRSGALYSSSDNYKEWKYDVLTESFGEPTFMKLEVEKDDLYKPCIYN